MIITTGHTSGALAFPLNKYSSELRSASFMAAFRRRQHDHHGLSRNIGRQVRDSAAALTAPAGRARGHGGASTRSSNASLLVSTESVHLKHMRDRYNVLGDEKYIVSALNGLSGV